MLYTETMKNSNYAYWIRASSQTAAYAEKIKKKKERGYAKPFDVFFFFPKPLRHTMKTCELRQGNPKQAPNKQTETDGEDMKTQ